MAVVTDWRDGRIQGWVEPPVLPVESSAEAAAKPVDRAVSGEEITVADQKQIVTEWAAEFKLDGLWGDDALKVDDAMEQ
jgi:nuclear GTP-binding protein